MPLFKAVRVMLLLFVLLFVALGAWHSRAASTDWDEPLWIVVYPINGDGRDATQAYIDNLTVDHFADIDAFMAEEAERYGVTIAQPTQVHLSKQLDKQPPATPSGENLLHTMWWSLKLRYWAWRVDNFDQASADIKVFAVYHDHRATRVVPNSFGLSQGLIAVAHLFATPKMIGSNNVVITHEMLHTLGASDKYDPFNNYPIYPHGFAEPEKAPRLPQQWAEIMGGRMPVSATRAKTPSSLSDTLIGDMTAVEINWLAPE